MIDLSLFGHGGLGPGSFDLPLNVGVVVYTPPGHSLAAGVVALHMQKTLTQASFANHLYLKPEGLVMATTFMPDLLNDYPKYHKSGAKGFNQLKVQWANTSLYGVRHSANLILPLANKEEELLSDILARVSAKYEGKEVLSRVW